MSLKMKNDNFRAISVCSFHVYFAHDEERAMEHFIVKVPQMCPQLITPTKHVKHDYSKQKVYYFLKAVASLQYEIKKIKIFCFQNNNLHVLLNISSTRMQL